MISERLLPALLVALATGQVAHAVPIPFPRANLADPSSTPYRITSAFGPRMISTSKFDIHEAIDFAGPPSASSPVYALESGEVSAIDFLQAKSSRGR